MSEPVRYNVMELKNLQKTLALKKKELQDQIEILDEKFGIINKLIDRNDKTRQSWVIDLPGNIAEGLSTLESSQKTKTNKTRWKKLTLEILKRYDIPMNSELMYHKAKQLYNDLPGDKKAITKNFSSALIYLCESGSLYRQKLVNSKEYVYGFLSHFDERGKIKEGAFKNFKIEVEGANQKRVLGSTPFKE